MVIAVLVIVVIAYALFHGHHYRRNRRRGFGIWYSFRGPFGTRETISRRF